MSGSPPRTYAEGWPEPPPPPAPVEPDQQTQIARLQQSIDRLNNRSIFWPVLGALIVWSLIPAIITVLVLILAGIIGAGASRMSS